MYTGIPPLVKQRDRRTYGKLRIFSGEQRQDQGETRGSSWNRKAKELEAKAAVDTKKELNKEIKGAKTKTVVEQTGHGNVHFVEDMFGREFFCSLQHVEWAEKMLNHLYTHDEKTDYNTFYELLGLKKTLSGWEYGWPRNEQFYDPESFGYSTDTPILFENTPCEDEDGNLCYVISVRMTPPVNGYLELED